MGRPKFSRKKFETPSHPWQENRIKEENEIVRKYGLKNKREVWKAQTQLRNYRGQARTLLAKVATNPQAKKESDQLLMHLTRYNILPPNPTLDDVLALDTETILTRRLQTQTYLKGLANTPSQARQLIIHGHVSIGDRKVTVPGYLVTKEEENQIGYVSSSALNDLMHPARPRADFKSPIPSKKPEKEEKPKEVKVEPKPEKKEESKVESAKKEVEPLVVDEPKAEKQPEPKTAEKPAEKISREEPTSEPEQTEKKLPSEEKTADESKVEQPTGKEETPKKAQLEKKEDNSKPGKKQDKGGK